MIRKYSKKLIYLILCISIILLCISCKNTEYVEVPVETIKTEYIVNKDSIYIHDSIWTLVEKQNDTVYIDRYKQYTKYVYKTDTISKTDTIPKIVTVTKVVEVNKLRKWQKILMWLGGGLIALFGGTIIFKLTKWKLLS